MELGKYKKQFKSCRTYKDKGLLLENFQNADNMLRKLFSQQRDSWVVPELDDPYQSLIPVFDHFDLFKCLKELPEEAAIPKVCHGVIYLMNGWYFHQWIDGIIDLRKV